MAVINDPGSVPQNWRPLPLDADLNLQEEGAAAVEDEVAPHTSTATGYCTRCQNGKPPRCHHCSVCMSPHFTISQSAILLLTRNPSKLHCL